MADEPTDQEYGSLVPSDSDDFSPSSSLDEIEARLDDPTLFGDDVQQDEIVIETAPQVYSLGRSWRFDFAQSRFVSAGGRSRSPLQISGLPQLEQWVEKCLYTPRGALPIHSDDYGLEDADAEIGSVFTPASAAGLRRRVTEAVTFHPKIIGVEDFEAQLADDDESLEVSFRLRLDNNDVVPFSTRLQ